MSRSIADGSGPSTTQGIVHHPTADRLLTPVGDVSVLHDLGVNGVPVVQYLKWADDVGLFVCMADRSTVAVDDIVAATSLTARGAEALIGVLMALKLVSRSGDRYALAVTASEYLDRRSLYYVGTSLYGMLEDAIPRRLCKGQPVRRFSRTTSSFLDMFRFRRSKHQWGRPERLLVQHSRNFPAAVVAVRSGVFDGVRHIADIGGGSGVFAIPLAKDRPDVRITLVELPRALPHIRPFLERFGVLDRVELRGFNVYRTPWPDLACDGVLLGNFLHFCDDDECRQLLTASYRLLPASGRIFVHEMLWNEQRDGPLVTAFWNFWLMSVSAGRQRTFVELGELLREAGFSDIAATPTAGGFSMVVGVKSKT